MKLSKRMRMTTSLTMTKVHALLTIRLNVWSVLLLMTSFCFRGSLPLFATRMEGMSGLGQGVGGYIWV